jgi:hypothetical protein
MIRICRMTSVLGKQQAAREGPIEFATKRTFGTMAGLADELIEKSGWSSAQR